MNIKIKKNLISFAIVFLLQLCFLPTTHAADEIEIEDEEREIEIEYAIGLTYKLHKLFHAGIELKGSEYGHYWGPTISHGTHDIWFSLGSAFALGTIKEGKPEMEIRMIMGVGLK